MAVDGIDCMEGNRALQTALELSMFELNLGGGGSTTYGPSCSGQESPFGSYFGDSPTSLLSGSPKKSQNITQCVAVPSSEHVAEIVGRQGKYPCGDECARLVLFATRLCCAAQYVAEKHDTS